MKISIFNGDKLFLSGEVSLLPIRKCFIFCLKNRKNIRITTKDFLPVSVQQFISSAVDGDNLKFIIRGGYNSLRQYIIVIYSGKKEIAYCKVGLNEYSHRIRREYDNYLFLNTVGISNIPKVYNYSSLDSGESVLILEPIYTNNDDPTDEDVFRFIEDMCKKTEKIIRFEDTDFSKCLFYILNRIDRIKNDTIMKFVKQNIMSIICLYEGKDVLFSLYHSDFKKGNYMKNKKIWVIDWETDCYSYPQNLDKYYYLFFSYDTNTLMTKYIKTEKDVFGFIVFIVVFCRKFVEDDYFAQEYHQRLYSDKIASLIEIITQYAS